MKIFLVDNYDSFTWNIVQLIQQSGCPNIEVVKKDEINEYDIKNFDGLVLSPGPGLPKDSPIMKELITKHKDKPILGICLGHQAIADAFGAKLIQCDNILHGVSSEIFNIGNDELFNGIDKSFIAGRYHSWIVDRELFPEELIITAVDNKNDIMAIKHREFPIRGVQFHPESFMTTEGELIIKNWLKMINNRD